MLQPFLLLNVPGRSEGLLVTTEPARRVAPCPRPWRGADQTSARGSLVTITSASGKPPSPAPAPPCHQTCLLKPHEPRGAAAQHRRGAFPMERHCQSPFSLARGQTWK